MGISLDHAVSMGIPTLGDLLWIHYGHSSVFIDATGLALLMLLAPQD